MTPTELLESVRRVEVRTNRLVHDTRVGAYLSHCKGRGMDFARDPLESKRVGKGGEFAIIKSRAGKSIPFLIPSHSTGSNDSINNQSAKLES